MKKKKKSPTLLKVYATNASRYTAVAGTFAQVNWLCDRNLICFNDIKTKNEKLDIINMIDDVFILMYRVVVRYG